MPKETPLRSLRDSHAIATGRWDKHDLELPGLDCKPRNPIPLSIRLVIFRSHRNVFDSSGIRLLLVQAEPVLAELTSFRLELLGYQVELVGSASEAMLSIKKSLPDLVIVDTHLPDMDGIEWITRLRADYSPDQIPVIVFSLDPSLETVERAHLSGAQDYLITPFDPTVMEDKIESQLRHHHVLRRR